MNTKRRKMTKYKHKATPQKEINKQNETKICKNTKITDKYFNC